VLELWIRQGFLIGVDAPVIRWDYVAREIADLAQKFKIRRIMYDPAYIDYLKAALADIGCNVVLEPHRQGFLSFGPRAPCAGGGRLRCCYRARRGRQPESGQE